MSIYKVSEAEDNPEGSEKGVNESCDVGESRGWFLRGQVKKYFKEEGVVNQLHLMQSLG